MNDLRCVLTNSKKEFIINLTKFEFEIGAHKKYIYNNKLIKKMLNLFVRPFFVTSEKSDIENNKKREREK